MSHPFCHLGWLFYRSGCSYPFFQRLYRTDFWQQLLIKTLMNTATYQLLSWKILRKVYLFNESSCCHPSLEVVVNLILSLKGWQSSIFWIVVFICCTTAVTRCHSFSIYCHSLSLVVSLVVTLCHLLSYVVTRSHSLSLVVLLVLTHCHSLSLVVPLIVTRCHSLSLDVPLTCLFINDHCYKSKISYEN